MRERLFSEAMSEVGDRYYEEVARYKRKRKNPAWIKWGAAAACFVAAIAVYMFIQQPADKPAPLPPEGETMVETSNLDIYYLSENGTIESRNITVACTPKDIFGEWAALNGVSDVTVVDCVYSNGGTENTGSLVTEYTAGNYFTLSLSVSPEFSAYAEGEDSGLLMESLRQTFYDYIYFDEFNLIVGELTYQMISMGVMEPGMQADDGKSLVWEEMSEREIDGTECYAFELRYSEDEGVNGEMATRLIGIYAISKDGMVIYHYDQANDIWEQIWPGNESPMEPGAQADDGRSLVWGEMNIREIDGEECYAFELKYSDDEGVNGEMAGRLVGIYAISKDGMEIYHYNQADDIWE